MLSFSKNTKALFWHVHKTGGTYIDFILRNYYGFCVSKSNNILKETDISILKDSYSLNLENGIIKQKIEVFNLRNIIDVKNLGYFGLTLKNYILKLDIEDYFKFAFVRNPYDRAISSYEYIKQKKFDDRVSPLVLNEECTFTHFYIKKFNYDINIFMNQHAYESQYNTIKNGASKIQIDYIAKYENINEELINILKRIGIEDYTKHLHLIDEECRVNASQKRKLSEYFTEEALEEINILFHDDFEKFGYKKFYKLEELNNFLDTIEETEKNNNKKLLEFYNYQSKELTEEDLLKEFS